MKNANSTKEETRLFKLLMSIYFAAIAMRILFCYYYGVHGFLASLEIIFISYLKNAGASLFFIAMIIFIILTSIAIIWSSIKLLKKHHRNLSKAMPLLVINLCTLIILLSPHEFIVLPDFYFNLKDRVAVVSTRESWQLKKATNLYGYYSTSYKVELPAQYSHFSKSNNGAIALITDSSDESKMIIFTTSTKGRGYTAFVYKIDESEKIDGHELIGFNNIT